MFKPNRLDVGVPAKAVSHALIGVDADAGPSDLFDAHLFENRGDPASSA